MTEALTSMRAKQQAQQEAAPTTPTVTQGSEPFRELPVTQEAVLREAMRQAESTTVPQSARTLPATRKQLTTEELMDGLESDLGEKWNEIDEELRSKFVQAVNDRFVHTRRGGTTADRRTPSSGARRTPVAGTASSDVAR